MGRQRAGSEDLKDILPLDRKRSMSFTVEDWEKDYIRTVIDYSPNQSSRSIAEILGRNVKTVRAVVNQIKEEMGTRTKQNGDDVGDNGGFPDDMEDDEVFSDPTDPTSFAVPAPVDVVGPVGVPYGNFTGEQEKTIDGRSDILQDYCPRCTVLEEAAARFGMDLKTFLRTCITAYHKEREGDAIGKRIADLQDELADLEQAREEYAAGRLETGDFVTYLFNTLTEQEQLATMQAAIGKVVETFARDGFGKLVADSVGEMFAHGLRQDRLPEIVKKYAGDGVDAVDLETLLTAVLVKVRENFALNIPVDEKGRRYVVVGYYP